MTNRFFAGQTNFIEELNALDGESGDAQQAIDDHIADTTGAHAASAISNTPAGNIAATTVQAAINELDAAKANLAGAAFTGAVSATSFTGPLSGNASTATTLATARNINGVSFNGSADITVTAAAGTLTGATLAAGVTASSLTSVGTLTALTVSGTSTLGVTRASAADGAITFGVSGTTRGVRIFTSSYGTAIEGVDNTLGASYQPLNIVASALGLYTTGGSAIALGTSSGTPQMYVTNTTSAVNYATITGSATGNAVAYGVAGTDANIGLSVNTKGTGPMRVLLNSVEAARFSSASTLGTYWDFKYVSAINEMKLYTAGGAANLGFSSSGGGGIRFYTNDILEPQVVINRTASAVNQLALTGSATGGAVAVSAEGTDSNIDFAITPKGTGVLRFGTHSVIGAETVTGYITIKDAAGNTRKLAVLS